MSFIEVFPNLMHRRKIGIFFGMRIHNAVGFLLEKMNSAVGQ